MATTNQSYLARSSAWLAGIVLIVASVPLGGVALLLGSGGEMIAFGSSADHLRLAALVSFPVLIFAIGGALLWASRTARYGPALALALLIPVDVAAIAGTFWFLDGTEQPAIIPPDRNAMIPASTMNGSQVTRPSLAEGRVRVKGATQRRSKARVWGAISPARP